MYMNMKRAKLMAYGMAVCFLSIHLLMINIFEQCNVTPMVRFNIFSIIFYICIMWVIHKGWLQFYAVAVYIEVALHMTLSVVYTGWDSGFQITLIGMNVLAFYAEYVGRTIKIKIFPMLPIGIIGMVLYIGSYIYQVYNPPVYSLPMRANFGLTILWAVIVFVINVFVLQLFVLIVKSSEDKLEYQMSHDKLTGLPNRYYVSNHLREIEEATGFENYWVGLSDIDDFKKVNDNYGHNCGDYVLKTVANLISDNEDVLCCRWGGEEFIFVGKTNGSDIGAHEYLESCRKKVEEYPFAFEGAMLSITMTFGLEIYSSGMGIDDWINEADEKLYYGKHSGKNKVVD